MQGVVNLEYIPDWNGLQVDFIYFDICNLIFFDKATLLDLFKLYLVVQFKALEGFLTLFGKLFCQVPENSE